jgi:xylono-1,5-lactonase
MSEIIRRSKSGALLGEGAMWSKRDGCVYWVDILSHRLHAYCLEDNSHAVWQFDEPIGWVIEREKGGFIAGFKSGFAELSLAPLTIKHIANPYPHEPENRMNDAKACNMGSIWAGSMHMPIEKVSGAFYRLDPDMTITEVDGPYEIANGPTFSPDFKTVYHTDTAKREIYAFDLNSKTITNKRLFVAFDEASGFPDGMATDAQGGIWVAHWGGGKSDTFLSRWV